MTHTMDTNLYEILTSATTKIMKAVGQAEFVESILQQMIDAIPQLDSGFLLIYSEKTQKLIVKHAVGYVEENYRKTQLIPGEGISGQVFATGHPLFLTSRESVMSTMRTMSPANLSHYIKSTIQAEYPHQTIAIPLLDERGAIGVLTMSGHDEKSRYPSSFMNILHSFTPFITLAYRHHMLSNREAHLENELVLATTALRKEHDQQQKTADLYNELTMLSNQNKGIQKMVQALQQYIEAPIALYDDLFNLIAEVEMVPTELPSGMISTREVQYVITMKKWQVYDKKDGTSIIIIPIVGSNLVIGFLLTYIEKEKFHHVNRMLLEYGSSLLSLEMMKQQSIREAQQMIYGEIFEKILLGIHDGQLEEQANNLGLHPKDYYVALICSEMESAPYRDSRFEREKWMKWIEEMLIFYHIKGIVTQRGNQVIAFLSFPKDEGKVKARQQVTQLTKHMNEVTWPVYIGLGNVYEGFHEIRKSYRDAEKSITLLMKRKKGQVHQFSNGGIDRILLDLERNELEAFLSDHLGPLVDNQNVDLIETLLAYVQHNKNLKNVTESLVIHQNTLYYRLKRIEEILEISLADPAQWFDIQLACKIYDYLRL
ncbi:sugar diacid utilization regulator [Bacillus sp. OxB-1]|uniref:helix-turn-helix domain-containing protein n=1 Tax=Bacillus sp. (strain OxB-1) TaxID=98228 RepID=UPI000581D2E2|nr:helix-turn-helix domain-containing protein [Bacillus sp. OxB-1]BAQ10030.1 sugar diacid utilization regulator [Bacillus sp. OxB-1]